ncbi:lysis system i-spanin subunit Rz [Kosakonia cowanii]
MGLLRTDGKSMLTDATEPGCSTLRVRTNIAGKQIAGLQQYITEQCQK